MGRGRMSEVMEMLRINGWQSLVVFILVAWSVRHLVRAIRHPLDNENGCGTCATNAVGGDQLIQIETTPDKSTGKSTHASS